MILADAAAMMNNRNPTPDETWERIVRILSEGTDRGLADDAHAQFTAVDPLPGTIALIHDGETWLAVHVRKMEVAPNHGSIAVKGVVVGVADDPLVALVIGKKSMVIYRQLS